MGFIFGEHFVSKETNLLIVIIIIRIIITFILSLKLRDLYHIDSMDYGAENEKDFRNLSGRLCAFETEFELYKQLPDLSGIRGLQR